MPRMIPTIPPDTESASDSAKNCARIFRGFAPTAMRRPISRVRSVTLTSMMFMIPMPPTSSETAAIAARSSVRALVACVTVLAMSAQIANVEIIVRAEVDVMPVAQQRRDLRSARAAVSSSETAPTTIVPFTYFWIPPWMLDWYVVSGMKTTSSLSWPFIDWPLDCKTPITWNGTLLIRIVWPTGFVFAP